MYIILYTYVYKYVWLCACIYAIMHVYNETNVLYVSFITIKSTTILTWCHDLWADKDVATMQATKAVASVKILFPK